MRAFLLSVPLIAAASFPAAAAKQCYFSYAEFAKRHGIGYEAK